MWKQILNSYPSIPLSQVHVYTCMLYADVCMFKNFCPVQPIQPFDFIDETKIAECQQLTGRALDDANPCSSFQVTIKAILCSCIHVEYMCD